AAAVPEDGKQTALMAPTEILARQHVKTITPLAESAGLRVAILTGREKGKERGDILARLEAGEIDFLVGTHALIQDDVIFKALALAVVDEQHRFGVRERLALTEKGEAVDVLVLSATPIPRTLVLTYFGDMDVSELREKPAGRQPIDTRAVPIDRFDEVVAAIGRALTEGRRVGGPLRCVEGVIRKPRGPRSRPHERGRQGCRHGALLGRRNPPPGRHH